MCFLSSVFTGRLAETEAVGYHNVNGALGASGERWGAGVEIVRDGGVDGDRHP